MCETKVSLPDVSLSHHCCAPPSMGLRPTAVDPPYTSWMSWSRAHVSDSGPLISSCTYTCTHMQTAKVAERIFMSCSLQPLCSPIVSCAHALNTRSPVQQVVILLCFVFFVAMG